MSRSRHPWRQALAAGCAAAAGAVPGALAATEDIRDIRVPQAQPAAWLLPLLAGAALLCGIVLVLWWRRRRRRAPSPAELALQQLEQARALIPQSRPEAFCVATSGIVRRYIEQVFDTAATDRTTEEFLHSLAQSSDARLGRHRAPLADFLQQCDLVKFGGVSPPPTLLESLYQGARTFVVETAAETNDALPAA